MSESETPSTYAACELEAQQLALEMLNAARSEQILAPGRASRGERLSPLLVEFFVHELSLDFRHVQLHKDAAAAEFAARQRACAIAQGTDLIFAAGRFAPHTDAGFMLLAHELVHVAQQGGVPRAGRGQSPVRLRFTGRVQHSFDPSNIYKLVCPPGAMQYRVSSSGLLGTRYGWWLGGIYKALHDPDPYCLIDHWVFRRGSWIAEYLRTLAAVDPGVALAFVNTKKWLAESGRYRYRADILDSQRDELYEIKPITKRDEGVEQLNRYLKELQNCAQTTGPIHSGPRSRLWTGGNWDPTPYPMVVPSSGRRVCIIRARQDGLERGLLLYDIVCCDKSDIDELPDEIGVPRVRSLVPEFLNAPSFVSQIQSILDEQLPFVPMGASYAIVVPWRVFQAFVLAPRDREWQERYDRIYTPQPSPAMAAFLLQTFVLAYVLAPNATTAVASIVSGPIPAETIEKLWKIDDWRAKAGAAAGAGIAAAVLVPAGAALGTGIATTVPEAAALAAGMAAVDTSAAALTAVETAELQLAIAAARAAAAEAAAANVLSKGGGLAAGEAVSAGASLPAWLPAGVGSGTMAGSARAGISMIGLLVTALTSARVDAATVSNPPPPTVVVGADPVYLLPTELLTPKRGIIELGAEVLYGEDRCAIVGFVGTE